MSERADLEERIADMEAIIVSRERELDVLGEELEASESELSELRRELEILSPSNSSPGTSDT